LFAKFLFAKSLQVIEISQKHYYVIPERIGPPIDRLIRRRSTA
jgi:hypothetical protein